MGKSPQACQIYRILEMPILQRLFKIFPYPVRFLEEMLCNDSGNSGDMAETEDQIDRKICRRHPMPARWNLADLFGSRLAGFLT